MRPMKSDRTTAGTRRAWEPPVITAFPIGSETKSPRAGEPGTGQAAQPSPPADPATKLGFSFEMAFPLSTRILE
jgi:hypothetical protein